MVESFFVLCHNGVIEKVLIDFSVSLCFLEEWFCVINSSHLMDLKGDTSIKSVGPEGKPLSSEKFRSAFRG